MLSRGGVVSLGQGARPARQSLLPLLCAGWPLADTLVILNLILSEVEVLVRPT